MSTDKRATAKPIQLSTKVWVKLLLTQFVNAVFPTLTKQTILSIQKAMPIILALFSTKMWFLLFSGNNLPRPNTDPRTNHAGVYLSLLFVLLASDPPWTLQLPRGTWNPQVTQSSLVVPFHAHE